MKFKAIAIVLFIVSFTFAQLNGPKIYTPNDKFDFGDVKQGDVVKHRFVLVNNGDDLLKIRNVVTSCGCTAAEPDKKELAPQESATISIEFNTNGRVGKQIKYITVYSNDANNSALQLIVTGNIIEVVQLVETPKPKLSFAETQHDFGIVKEGQVMQYTFSFKNTGTADLEIKDVKTSCGCTAAVISNKIIKPGDEGSLKIEFDTANRSGKTSKIITVTSNDADEFQKILTIYADISK
jgi:hypothetical protein